MYQKPDKNPTTKYHWIAKAEGEAVRAACGFLMHQKPELQGDDPWKIGPDNICKKCWELQRLLCTSAADMRDSLRLHPYGPAFLQLAYDLACERSEVTKARLIEAKLKKAKKAVAK